MMYELSMPIMNELSLSTIITVTEFDVVQDTCCPFWFFWSWVVPGAGLGRLASRCWSGSFDDDDDFRGVVRGNGVEVSHGGVENNVIVPKGRLDLKAELANVNGRAVMGNVNLDFVDDFVNQRPGCNGPFSHPDATK